MKNESNIIALTERELIFTSGGEKRWTYYFFYGVAAVGTATYISVSNAWDTINEMAK